MHCEVKPAVSDDSEITIVNYFIKTASVNQEAYYSDVAGNLTPKKRFTKSTDKYYSLFFEDALLMNDNSLFSKNLNTKSGMDHGYFASGSHSGYSLRIKENAGYTLSKLKLSCSGVGDWELTREQLTNVQVPDTGDNVIDFDISKVKKGSLSDGQFADLQSAFAYLKDNQTYTVQAYFCARFIHVTAYEVDQEMFEEMREVGVMNYMNEHSLGLFPADKSVKMRVGDTTYSVDGAQTGQYYNSLGNRVSIGVRDGTQPTCVICPVVVVTNGSSEKPLKLGSVKDSTFTLTTDSEMTPEAVPATSLRFTLGEESGFRLADDPFRAEYSNNGSTPSAINATGSGSIYVISPDYAVDKAEISVDVYYLPTYRVYYHGNGNDSGSEPTDTHEYASGDVLGSSGHPLQGAGSLARRGFTFDGWSTQSGDSNSSAKVTEVTFSGMDIDLYAVWTPRNPLHVTYDGNGNTSGTAPADSESYYEGETVTVLGRNGNVYYSGDEVTVLGTAETEKTDGGVKYRFDGWDTSDSADTAVYVPADAARGKFHITANTDLYAVWTALYSVTYHGNGNTGGEAPIDTDNPYDSGESVTVKDKGTLTKTGYSFTGWSLTESGTVNYQPDASFNIDSDTDLYAVWTINSHKVRYSLTVPDDVHFTVPTEQTYDYGKPVNVAQKPGASDYDDPLKYTFHGWNTASTDLGMNDAGTSFTMPDHDVEFTGYFTENGKVNLSYNANGGTPSDKVPASVSKHTRIETTVAELPEDCVKRSYTFDHWNTAADGSGVSYEAGDPITVEGSDVVLYAQWSRNSYTVEYYGLKNGETGEKLLKQVNYPFGDTTEIGGVTLDEIPGKVFKKWALVNSSQNDADGQPIGERLSFPMPDETVAYRAVYDDLIYNVEYSYTGAVPTGAPELPTDDGNYSFGGSVNVASVPTMAGYTLDGWKLGEVKTTGFAIDADTPVTVSGTLTRTITLTGAWVKNGDVSITYTSGFTDENAPDDSLKFVGRDTCTKGLDYTLKPNSGFTNYSYPGYTFSGWKIVSETVSPAPTGFFARMFSFFQKRTLAVGDVYGEGDTISALSRNITVEAVWTQNPPEPEKFRVTYDGNGATGGEAPTDSKEYAAGDTPDVLGRNTLVKTGSEFKGWNTKADGNGTTYQPSGKFTISNNVTLYAMWSKNNDTQDNPGKPGNPGTGESVWLIVLAAAALLLSCGAIFTVLYRRRKK